MKQKDELKICKTIMKFKFFTLDFVIMLNKPKVKNKKKLFADDNSITYNIDPVPLLVINATENCDNNEEWRKWIICINQANQFVFISKLEKIIHIIENNELFYREGEILKIRGLTKKDIVYLNETGRNNIMIFEPALVSISELEIKEGVGMFINKKSNMIPVTLDEIKLLKSIVEKIDMFLYTHTLLIYDSLKNRGE